MVLCLPMTYVPRRSRKKDGGRSPPYRRRPTSVPTVTSVANTPQRKAVFGFNLSFSVVSVTSVVKILSGCFVTPGGTRG